MLGGPIYEATRAFLVALWCVAAVLCFRRRTAGFAACGVLGLLLASFRAFLWNYELGSAARDLGRRTLPPDLLLPVRAAGTIAVGLATVAVLLLVARRRRWALFCCATGIAAVALLVLVESVGLDESLPGFLTSMPGRYVYEYAGAGIAIFGAAVRRR